MPPFIPDEDDSDVSDGVEEVMPAKKQQKPKSKTPVKKPAKAAKPAEPVDESNDEEDAAEGDQDDSEEEEEEYQVEKIISHAFDPDGTVKYEVKWLGYEAKKERTWEPVQNLSGAPDILNEYHKKIGGPPTKPQTPAKKGRGKRKSQPPDPTPDVDESTTSKKRKTNGITSVTKPAILDYKLPIGSWEDDIESIDSIAEKLVAGKSRNTKPTKELYVLAIWNNGARFEHSVQTVRQKCPQKLLDYLLSKVVFKTIDPDVYTRAYEHHALHKDDTDVRMDDE